MEQAVWVRRHKWAVAVPAVQGAEAAPVGANLDVTLNLVSSDVAQHLRAGYATEGTPVRPPRL